MIAPSRMSTIRFSRNAAALTPSRLQATKIKVNAALLLQTGIWGKKTCRTSDIPKIANALFITSASQLKTPDTVPTSGPMLRVTK
ncbi:hypothetical protein SDC9_193682 [bioreactor metagenome]|uniref:Uncharacterized protein n=1 Tax=bioreactor metagenome TaxID=1076179 RepID=A0A645I5P3_9ZZZZ